MFFSILFFSQIFGFLYLLDIWVLRDPRSPAKKNKIKKKTFVKRRGRDTLNTCANFRVYLSKTAWTFGLLCGHVQISRLGNVITWF